MYTLEVMGHVDLSTRRPIPDRPLVIGRDPDCDIVIAHEGVSRRHAAVWMEGEVLWIEDLKSSNGVFVNDVRVEDKSELRVGQRVRLGALDALRVRPRSVLSRTANKVLVVVDVESGARFVLGHDPLTIGSSSSCGVRLAGGPAVAGIVVLQGEDEVWFGVGDDMTELADGQTFEVGGRTLRLMVEAKEAAVTIADVEPSSWPYQIIAQLNAPGGPLVTVEAPAKSIRIDLHATNTAILLYLLARAWRADEDAGVAVDRCGWMDDDAAAVGVWGKDGPLRQLRVLVCRLRQEVREGGLDPWFIEKRRGAMRVRVVDVVLHD